MDLILYNPLSKNSKSNIQTNKLVRHYKKNNIPFRLKSIVKIKDIETYLESKTQIDNIILLGGDGTINRFINNTYNFDVSQDIYLKKNGSGNDFLRTLISQDKESQQIMQITTDTNLHKYFINGTGMGIDGYVGSLINKSKRKGKFRYFFNTIKALITYIPEPINVEIDGETFHFKKTFLVAMSNGKYFGGGMRVAPNATVNDGLLDVIVVHTISKILILPIFLTIYFGKHIKFKKYVFYKRGKEVTATFTTPQIAQTDGENYFDITTITARSASKKIHLRSFENK